MQWIDGSVRAARRTAFLALIVAAGLVAACGSGAEPTASGGQRLATLPPLPTIAPSDRPTERVAPTLDLSGNTSSVPFQIADTLGCTNVESNPQLDNYVAAEVTCLYDGDNEVTIFAFASAANAQKWAALGPESADESGTFVLGDTWAVEPFNPAQVVQIQHVLGGVITGQP